MHHHEMIALIRAGVDGGDTWADFGAGRGAFTQALRDLLGATATIYAVDRDAAALRAHPPEIITTHADFTGALDLPPLDGILIANALHFVEAQAQVLRRIADYLKPGGTLLVVEYEQSLPWTPHPLPYHIFANLAHAEGFTAVQQIGKRISPRTGVTMYAARAQRAGYPPGIISSFGPPGGGVESTTK